MTKIEIVFTKSKYHINPYWCGFDLIRFPNTKSEWVLSLGFIEIWCRRDKSWPHRDKPLQKVLDGNYPVRLQKVAFLENEKKKNIEVNKNDMESRNVSSI